MARRWDLTPPLTTLLVGACLILGVTVVRAPGGCDAGALAAETSRSSTARAVHIVVLSSSNKGPLMQEMACRFEQTDPRVGDRLVDVVTVAEPSGVALDEIASLRPDVWSPASSSWIGMLRTRYPDWMSAEPAPSIAQSPQVIAMPKPIATRLGWPEKQIGWEDVLDLATDERRWSAIADPAWGAFKLAKTNPLFSTSGLNATIATYQVATGHANDLTLPDLEDPRVLAFVKGVESAVVHYAPTSVEFLRNLRAHDAHGDAEQYVSAVLLEEKSVWDYNRGNPSGDPATLGDAPPPATPLVAFYPPEGAIVADHPYVILTADWVTPAERRGATAFLRFLGAPDQQARFESLGFRGADGAPGPQITQDNGLIPAEPTLTLTPPGGDVMLQVRNNWSRYRKRARVLILLDVSGSMRSVVPGTGRSKLQLAKGAALGALEQLGPEDEVGLWTFSSSPSPFTERVPIGSLSTNEAALRSAVEGLQAGGGTHLYSAVEAAEQEMRSGFDPSKINGIILLSDGVNEDPANHDRSALLDAVAPQDPDHEIRVFTIAYGDVADVETLGAIATTSLGTAYDATEPTTIEQVFRQVVANF